MWAVELSVMAVMIGFNAVLAGYEIALASVSAARLRVLNMEKRAGAAAAVHMKENLEASLAVVQLGITLVGMIAGATGGVGAGESIAPFIEQRSALGPTLAYVLAIALVVIPLTGLTILFGELVPKVLALRNQEWVCLRLSPAMRAFSFAVWPIVWLFEAGVDLLAGWSERGDDHAGELQELGATARLARASRLISAREEGIILGAARLSSRGVREIILPAEHISMLDLGETVGNSLLAAHLDMHTRFPVTERKGDPQAIIGYVNFKDLVACLRLNPQDANMKAIIRPIVRLDSEQLISACLERMIRERTHIALVCDDLDKVIGMITMEDILEELVGDIQDEYDRLPTQVTPIGTGWVVGGAATLDQIKSRTGLDLGVDLPTTPARTLNDWVVGHLATPITGGEILERSGVRLLVRKVRRQKVLEAQLSKL